VQSAVIETTGVDVPTEDEWRGVESVYVIGAGHLEGVQCLPALERVILESSTVASLAPLSESTRLLDVTIDSDQVTDLIPLSGNRFLKQLNVRNAPVGDWDCLSEFRNLRSLYLENVPSFTVSELVGLDQLTSLTITSVPVTSIDALVSLPALYSFVLLDTQVSDVSVLPSLGPNLRQVILKGTALRSETFTEDIPALLGKWVCVEWTDPEGILHREPQGCFSDR
jgi:Leucine-rich repeat (LRR) protein